MKTGILAASLLAASSIPAGACTISWTWDQVADPTGWIDGFKIYKDGSELASVGSAERSIDCQAAGVAPGDVVYATSYIGTVESIRSNEVQIQLKAPVLSQE